MPFNSKILKIIFLLKINEAMRNSVPLRMHQELSSI